MNAFEQKRKSWLAFEQGPYKKTLDYCKEEINKETKNGGLFVCVTVPLAQADKIRDYFMRGNFWVEIPLRYYEDNIARLYISWK